MIDGLDITDEKRDEYRRLIHELGFYRAFPPRVLTDEEAKAPTATATEVDREKRNEFINRILEQRSGWRCRHNFRPGGEVPLVGLNSDYLDAVRFRLRAERVITGDWALCHHSFDRYTKLCTKCARTLAEVVEEAEQRITKAKKKAKPWSACPRTEEMLNEIWKDVPRCTSCSGSIMQRKAVGPAHVLRNVWECPVCHSELEDVEAVEVKPLQLPPHGDGLH